MYREGGHTIVRAPQRRFKPRFHVTERLQATLRTLQLDLRRLVDAGILERKGERKAASYRMALQEKRGRAKTD